MGRKLANCIALHYKQIENIGIAWGRCPTDWHTD